MSLDRAGSIQRIERVLNQGLVTADGKNLFAGRFAYLNTAGLSPAQIFEETLAVLFNAVGGGALHVENLKGATGEIALRVGDNDPFGVINVGDDAKLVKLCEDEGISNRRPGVFRLTVPRDQYATIDGEPADRLEEIHRGLEQLACQHDGPDERGPDGGLSNHSAIRPRGAAEGLWFQL